MYGEIWDLLPLAVPPDKESQTHSLTGRSLSTCKATQPILMVHLLIPLCVHVVMYSANVHQILR